MFFLGGFLFSINVRKQEKKSNHASEFPGGKNFLQRILVIFFYPSMHFTTHERFY